MLHGKGSPCPSRCSIPTTKEHLSPSKVIFPSHAWETARVTPKPHNGISKPPSPHPHGQDAPWGRCPSVPKPPATLVSPSPAGIRPTDPEALVLARSIALGHPELVTLVGIYAHCGNTYGCRDIPAIQAIARATTTAVLEFVTA